MADRRKSSGCGTEMGDLRDTLQRSLRVWTKPLFLLIYPVLALFLIASCGDSGSGGGCIEEFGSGGSLIVSVGCSDPRTKPLYVWDLDKKVVEVKVFDNATDEVVWSVFSAVGDDTIESPVQHGTLPFGSSPGEGTETELEIGKRYIVRVAQLVGEIGSIEFEILPE